MNTSSNANATPVTFDFSDNPPQGDIRFYLTAGSSDGGTPYFKVNGVDSEIGFSGAAGWVSPGNIGPGGRRPTELTSFSYNNGGGGTSYVAIAAVEVGGKILIDAGAQWDQSQVWSDYGTITGSYSATDRTWAQAFDGVVTPASNSKPISWLNRYMDSSCRGRNIFYKIRLYCGHGGGFDEGDLKLMELVSQTFHLQIPSIGLK